MDPIYRLIYRPFFCFLAIFTFYILGPEQATANNPCTAFCYDFSCNANNCSVTMNCTNQEDYVPCGNGANTSPGVDVDMAGPTTFPLAFPGGDCGSGTLPAPHNDVAWITMVVTGSSFEWQVVETGGDDVYYEFYYSNLDPDDPNACTNLTYYTCGDDFSSWELIGSPSPSQPVRFYVALYSKNPDNDVTVNLKFRKACGEACTNSDIAATASVDQCIMAGSQIALSANGSGGGGGPYSFLWSPNDGSIVGANNTQSIMVQPNQTTVYTAQVIGADGCPAFEEVNVQVGGCCFDPPTIHCPPDYTGCPGESTNPSNTGMATATTPNNCWPAVITFDDIVMSTGPCTGETKIKRTWTATDPDAPNRTDQCVQIITLKAGPPTISCPGPATVSCQSHIDPQTGDASVSTTCGQGFSVQILGPVTSGSGCVGKKFTYTYKVTDDCGRTATCEREYTLNSTQPPTVPTPPADVTIDCDDPLPAAVQLTAQDDCDGAITVDPVDVNMGGSCPGDYLLKRKWTFTDQCGNSSSVHQFIKVEDNEAPMFQNCPGDIVIDAGSNCNGIANWTPPTSTDNCGTPTVVSNFDPGDEFPVGMTTVTYTATDACHQSNTCSFKVTVRPAVVQIQCPPDYNGCPGDDIQPSNTGTASSSTTCVHPSITFADKTTSTGDCAGEKVIKRTWTATDPHDPDNTAECIQIITLAAGPPTISCPFDMTVTCESAIDPQPSQATVSTTCGLGYRVDVLGPHTNGSGCNGKTFTYTFKVTDDCGRTASCQQKFTLNSNQAPVPPSAPANITIECDEPVPSGPALTAHDDCDGDITVDPTDTNMPGSCPQNYVIKRKWVFTDACGNSKKIEQFISVKDTKAPVFTHVPSGQQVCGDNPGFGTPTATDNCGHVTITKVDNVHPGNCHYGSTVTRIWTATDECGNTSTASATNTFNKDNEAPEFWDCPYNITIDANNNCVGTPHWTPPVATDNCGTPSVTSNFNPGDEFPIGMTVVKYIATDDCGNTDICTFKVTVNGNPLQIHCPNDVYKNCDSYYGGTHVSWPLPQVDYGCGSGSNSCNSSPAHIPGFVYMGEHNNSRYYCSTFAAKWHDARNYSNSKGGYLAIINDAQENAFLTGLLQAPYAYIGLSDEAQEGQFVWEDGSIPTYTNWVPGQPSNSHNQQHWVEMFGASHTYAGKWNDQYVDRKREFVMEIPCSEQVHITQTKGPARGSFFYPGDYEICYKVTKGSYTDYCCFDVKVNPISITCPDDVYAQCSYGQYKTKVTWPEPEVDYCGTDCTPGRNIQGFIYMGEYNGHSYYCSNFTADWHTADQYSRSNGGYLAQIDDQGENTFLANLVEANAAYIGLTDESVEGQFRWPDGSSPSWANWLTGQPNNHDGMQHYVELFGKYSQYKGTWNDTYAYDKREFIMEIPCLKVEQIKGPSNGSYLTAGTYEVKYRISYPGGPVKYCTFHVNVDCSSGHPDYCDSYSHNSSYFWINSVKLGYIHNVSGNDGGYGDYTHLTTNLYSGYGYYLTLKTGYHSTAYPVYWQVWIDYNQDGDFYDYGERVVRYQATHQLTGIMGIPTWAHSGPTRMRIQMSYYGYCSGPCAAFPYGEVEDYTINIKHPSGAMVEGPKPLSEGQATFTPEDVGEFADFPERPQDLPVFIADTEQIVPQILPPLGGEADIQLFPNPVSETLQVYLNGIEEGSIIRVYNQLGQALLERTTGAENTERLTVGKLANGLYFLEVQRPNGMKISKNFNKTSP